MINIGMTIALLIGGFVAFRSGFTRTANEVQERVIHALQGEIQTLHDRITALEQENQHLHYTITTICTALKQRGIHITIDGDTISIQGRFSRDTSYRTRITGTEAMQRRRHTHKSS